MTRVPARESDYSGAVGISEYAPGDVVVFSHGPFGGICAVVQSVDTRRSTLGLEFAVGTTHREGGVLREDRHRMTVGFDEVELL